MRGVAANVAGRCQDIRCDLALQAEIPRLHRWRLHVVAGRWQIIRKWQKRRVVLIHNIRERIATRKIPIRIVQTAARRRHARSERIRRRTRAVTEVRANGKVVTDTVSHANGCLPVALRIPGQTDARRKTSVLRVDGRIFRESRIAVKIETCRCVLVYRALDAFMESVVIKGVDRTQGQAKRQEGFPAQTIVQRHFRSHLPRVLPKETDIGLTRRPCGLRTLSESGDVTQHEIGKAETSCVAREGEVAGVLIHGVLIDAPVCERAAKSKLMAATNQTDIVTNLITGCSKRCLALSVATEIESTRNGHDNEVRQRTVSIDANFSRRE